jgi:hypothetical protein
MLWHSSSISLVCCSHFEWLVEVGEVALLRLGGAWGNMEMLCGSGCWQCKMKKGTCMLCIVVEERLGTYGLGRGWRGGGWRRGAWNQRNPYPGTTPMQEWTCYKGVTRVLRGCYGGAAMVLQVTSKV